MAAFLIAQGITPPPADAGVLGWVIAIFVFMLCAVSFAYAMDRRSEVKHLRDQNAEADKLLAELQGENRALIKRAADATAAEASAKNETTRLALHCAERHQDISSNGRPSKRRSAPGEPR